MLQVMAGYGPGDPTSAPVLVADMVVTWMRGSQVSAWG